MRRADIRAMAPMPSVRPSRAEALIAFEGLIRDARDMAHLKCVLAADVRDVLPCDEAYLAVPGRGGAFRPVLHSQAGAISPDTPRGQWIAEALAHLNANHGSAFARPGRFDAAGLARVIGGQESAPHYRRGLWLPLEPRGGGLVGGLVLLRADAWSEADVAIAGRVAATGAHAWAALQNRQMRLPGWVKHRRAGVAIAAIALAMCLPVQLRVLAPFEVVPDRPALVTAPVAGTIAKIDVAPNTPVQIGARLFSLDTTEAANAARIADRQLVVASVKRKRLEQRAISDAEAKSALASALAEERLARAERDYARTRLGRMVVRAARGGVVQFTDPADWIGKPVNIGERVMEIADTARVAARIDLPVADAVVLQDGRPVRMFASADPLTARAGVVVRASHLARPTPDGVLAHALRVRFDDDRRPLPIGSRGTAEITGERVTLFYLLFRRPLAFLRQWAGV